jgi:hypothetical protein
MTWFVGAISRREPENWEACKSVGLWGVPTSGRKRRVSVEAGDQLVIWQAGQGYVAHVILTGPARTPADRTEAPWPGGLIRFGLVLPFDLACEVKKPINVPFVGPRQVETGVTKAALQSGFALMSEDGGKLISERLLELEP